MVKETKRKSRKAADVKTIPLKKLQLLAIQVDAEIRLRRIRVVLKNLAGMKEKSFNVRRFEANLDEAITRHRTDLIDDALEMLEILLDL